MFGSLFGLGARVINIPGKIVESAADIVTGGDGSSDSKHTISPVTPSDVVDNLAERLENLDK